MQTVRRLSKCTTSIALASLFASVTFAADAPAEDLQTAKRSVSLEFAECGVYYSLVREGLDRTLPPGSEKQKELADYDRFIAAAFNQQRALVSDEIATAHAKMALQKITVMTHGSIDNISIAAAEYAYPCKALLENPAARLQYYMNKK